MKGLIFASISMVLVGIQPIIALGRDPIIDAYFFASITCLYQAFIFFPFMYVERMNIKNQIKRGIIETKIGKSLLRSWKKKRNFIIIIYIGINFSLSQLLFFVSFDLAGSINGSLAQKSTVIFGVLFGYLINNERISLQQIIFSITLIFGVILAVTQAQFNLLEINIGVLLMIIVSLLWMLAHSIVSKYLIREKQISSIQIVFSRNLLNGLILITTYFMFFPIERITLLLIPIHQFFLIIFAINYSLDLFCWYTSLKYLDVSKATVIIAPAPIITAIFSTLFLKESFTLIDLIGMLIVVISIFGIMWQKKPKNSQGYS